jgi:hypothetical protein
MVRSFQETTFSNSAYFDDRGEHGVAQPITERVNVCQNTPTTDNSDLMLLKPHSRPVVSYYFPKGVGEHHYGVGAEPVNK